MVESRFAGEREIKGKSEPQRIFQLDALRPGAVRFDAALSRGLTTYIGRDRELETLERLVVEARSGLRVVDVSGGPGIGKSRLVYEFHQRVAKTRTFILAGELRRMVSRRRSYPSSRSCGDRFEVAVGEAEAAVASKLEDGLKVLGMASARNLGPTAQSPRPEAPRGFAHRSRRHAHWAQDARSCQQLLAERCRVSPVLMMLEDSSLDRQRVRRPTRQDRRNQRTVGADDCAYPPARVAGRHGRSSAP